MGLSIDREKIVKGLEYHLKELSIGKTCFECNYCGNTPCEIHLIADALTLLNEQKNQIEQLEYDLAVTQNTLNYYLNGNN